MPIASKPENMREYHGYAAADKEQDSRELYVYSEELLPFLRGEIKAVEVDNDVKTSSGTDSYSGQVKTTNVLKCVYRDDTSNRAFPPDVRKGEQVIIFNQGDTDTWYWKSEGRNDNSRRLETVRYHANATLDNAAELNDDNTYFLELDTRRHKRVRISTSNADGEEHRYLFQLDAENSQVFLGDDYGNQFWIDSNHPRLCMKNHDNSLIDLNMKNIIIACEDDITIMAKNGKCTIYSKDKMSQMTESTHTLFSKDDMTIQTGKNMLLQSGANMTQIAGGSWSLSYSGTGMCNGNGGTMTMKTSHFAIQRG